MASATEAKRTRPPGLDALVTTINLATLGLGTIISMAADSDGTRFVCTDSAIYAFSPNGMKLLIAGHKTERGFADGDSSAARFDRPCGITLDGKGNALVADTSNHALRKITLRCGTVTTLAGSGWRGYTDGIGEAACFNYPWGIVVDAQGTIFVADCWNHCLRQVEPDNGAVSTLAGDGNKSGDFADGQSASACFHHPRGLAVDTDGHLIVADFSNNCIRKVTIDEGRVTTVAGSAEAGAEFADGEATSARFHSPNGIAVDGNNNILVTDQENHRIRMIAGTGGRVTTVAGSAEQGMVDGTGVSVRFNGPSDLVLDERGVLLVLECDNAGSVRVVQASLAPPQRLAPKLRHAVQDSLWIDYNTLIGDTEFAEETFAAGRQHFPAHRCVSDSAEQGKVDDTGVCVCFSRPSDSALDEQGLLVMECDDAGSVHAVEASPAPKLAVQDPLQNPMRMDYNEIPMRMDMLGENNLADVTFQANEQCFPAHRCVLTQSPRRAAVRRNGTAGGAGGQGMSRLDAVVCVLKATGKALHYDVITRQAIHQGILHFTGTQGTVGESMKASLNKTIRDNKSAAVISVGKGMYGLKEWGRSGVAKEFPTPNASPALSSAFSPYSPTILTTTSPHIQSLPISPGIAHWRVLEEQKVIRKRCALQVSPDSTLTLAKTVAEGAEGELEWREGGSKVGGGGKADWGVVVAGGVHGEELAPKGHDIAELLN